MATTGDELDANYKNDDYELGVQSDSTSGSYTPADTADTSKFIFELSGLTIY